ncbi:type iv inositol polyphosphate 5-phosphatase 11 [Quercus suber]|uniref:Type iv inositol polyphosphate 5-phosphatase 11 n=1 Tax=Quercus suber TaxID=58331 RepID=A0AAW0LUM1_QUESU
MGFGFLRLCRAKSDLKRKPMSFKNNHTASHEGIKTVGVDNLCDFSSNSDLCVCIVTWNMNGQGKPLCNRCSCTCLDQRTQICSSKVDKHSIGGLGGLIGRKKGAVAIRINYKDIQMVFISCHLSAHAHKVDERNYECMHISHSLFSKNWNPYARPAHITIWLGDLNYRIHGIDTQPARNLIQKDLHENLTSKDQLLQEAERGHIFNGYCEGTLTFKPTYKYNIGSSNYDTSYKVRVPSWTDRVLFKIEDTQKINATLHSYQSMDDIMSSDHKPVKAHLCLKLNKLSSPMHQQEPRFLSR